MAAGLGLALTVLISGCSSTQSYTPNLNGSYKTPQSSADVLTNFTRMVTNRLPSYYNDEHQRCALLAVNYNQVGESCAWGSGNNGKGEVYVAAILPDGCRTMINSVRFRGDTTVWKTYACGEPGNWKFYN